ncbi:cyclase family protein [Hugenholtzia roseola]|uniref:cyclase family protein n=1 Tax=Hugenholtzia roseola TaxID=1002 RepID=UPI00041F5597|nr:cyclase family protein [Hugenholtzia roseola]
MQFEFEHQDRRYRFDSRHFHNLALPLRAGGENPNCYYAQNPDYKVIRFGDSFVGSVAEGGSVNYFEWTITPHGNGTHTECYGHIAKENKTVDTCFEKHLFFAKVISLEPTQVPSTFEKDTTDSIITLAQIKTALQGDFYLKEKGVEALIIRTLPNQEAKKNRAYSGTNPPYFEATIGTWLAQQEVAHFLTDLPSVDRESDGGALAFHKNFWQYPQNPRPLATISELIFVPQEVRDGNYLLSFLLPRWSTDAVPSQPILYDLLSF